LATIEDHRELAISRLFDMTSFSDAWKIWQPELLKRTNNFSSAYQVLKLGSQLSEVFLTTGEAGRGQGTVSSAGAAWEGLVCWYLNTVLSGTNAIAIKQAQLLVPAPISDALTVNYGTFQANTESDILVLVFPHGFTFPDDVKKEQQQFADDARSKIGDIEAHIVQCKTNWNDNAQIPMLWDMVYKSKGFKESGLTIGRNGVDKDDLADFSYAFVTVPTQKKEKSPKSSAVSVSRVRHLSGGNYWGKPTESGVAFGLDEYFKRKFSGVFPSTVDSHIAKAISDKTGWYSSSVQKKFVHT